MKKLLPIVALVCASVMMLTGCTTDKIAWNDPAVLGGVGGAIIGGPVGLVAGAGAGYAYQQGERNDKQDKVITQNTKDIDLIGNTVADFNSPAIEETQGTPAVNTNWRTRIAAPQGTGGVVRN